MNASAEAAETSKNARSFFKGPGFFMLEMLAFWHHGARPTRQI